MRRGFSVPRSERFARPFILGGLVLAGLAAAWPGWAYQLGGYALLRRLAMVPGLSLALWVMATALSLRGTTVLLRHPPLPSGQVSAIDVAYLVLGLILSTTGVCVLGTLLTRHLVTA